MEINDDSNGLFLNKNKEYHWAEITSWLKNTFATNTTQKIKRKFSRESTDKLLGVIVSINNSFSWYNSLEEPIPETLTEALKAFRLYVLNPDVAEYLAASDEFYPVFDTLMECLFTKKNGCEPYTKYLLQFFLNFLSVSSTESRKVVVEKVRYHLLKRFKYYFQHRFGHLYESTAIIYNLFCGDELKDDDIINAVLLSYELKENSNEYMDFLLEKIITENYFWENYDAFPVERRLLILGCLRELLVNPHFIEPVININDALPATCFNKLLSVFNKSANVIFQVTDAGSVNACEEVSLVIELLAHMSGDFRFLPFLKDNKEMFVNAGMLLINVHRLGKISQNDFTPVQKLCELQSPSPNLTSNPLFGFKASLIRLLGNLCWENRRMQDLAREAELIPIFLDCCNIDAKNPFITQWSILAIRNLCYNNIENQSIIAGLSQQGVVDSKVLNEFGLTLHTDDEISVGIVGLNINK